MSPESEGSRTLQDLVIIVGLIPETSQHNRFDSSIRSDIPQFAIAFGTRKIEDKVEEEKAIFHYFTRLE